MFQKYINRNNKNSQDNKNSQIIKIIKIGDRQPALYYRNVCYIISPLILIYKLFSDFFISKLYKYMLSS